MKERENQNVANTLEAHYPLDRAENCYRDLKKIKDENGISHIQSILKNITLIKITVIDSALSLLI